MFRPTSAKQPNLQPGGKLSPAGGGADQGSSWEVLPLELESDVSPIPSSSNKTKNFRELVPRKKFCAPLLASDKKCLNISEVAGNTFLTSTSVTSVPGSNFNSG